MKTISIYAMISGNIKQEIVLDIDLHKDDFLAGLNKGIYATNIGHGKVIEFHPIHGVREIGHVVSQEPLYDMEISDFEIAGE